MKNREESRESTEGRTDRRTLGPLSTQGLSRQHMKSLPSPKKVVQGIARATSFRRKTLQQQPKTLPTTDPTTESPAINDQEEASNMASPRAKSLPSPMQVAQGIARVTSFKRKTLQQQKVPTTATPTDESPTSEVSIEDIDDHEEARREEALLASLRNAREHNQLCAEPEDTLRSSAPMQLLTAGPDPGPFASPALEPPSASPDSARPWDSIVLNRKDSHLDLPVTKPLLDGGTSHPRQDRAHSSRQGASLMALRLLASLISFIAIATLLVLTFETSALHLALLVTRRLPASAQDLVYECVPRLAPPPPMVRRKKILLGLF